MKWNMMQCRCCTRYDETKSMLIIQSFAMCNPCLLQLTAHNMEEWKYNRMKLYFYETIKDKISYDE